MLSVVVSIAAVLAAECVGDIPIGREVASEEGCAETMPKGVLKDFKNPDSILRPAPFWAINDRITPEEIARQMNDMLDVGLSGGFFHSRAGLITDYLGDDWFAAMEAALKVANERDGYVWLYDEDLWPSGNAGGQVAGMKDEYRATGLDATLVVAGEPIPQDREDEELRAVYAINSRKGITLEEYKKIPADLISEAQDKERLVLKRRYHSKTGWWGGESYANLLHPEAMQKFMQMTHDVYYERLGSEFGKRIPGIFTDEPQVSQGGNMIAWYDGIPELYGKWHGRDFWQDLPYLYFDGPEARKVRLLFHRTILRQFLEAYSKPIFDWCEEHGIEHTGHYNAEDSFESQIRNHYGGIMAHYRYQQAPGIDHLCRQVDPLLLTCKQVSSAARQLGRPRVLTEIFGVSRHTNTFEDFKWLGDYDLVHGATFFCPHLTWYSARGRRKRDFPPNWNYQQTYWKELNPLNDYFTRVGYALTRGKAASNVLLLQSIESATASHRFGVNSVPGSATTSSSSHVVPRDVPTQRMDEIRALDSHYRKTLNAILNAGYDCDLGDESYIEDMGSVKDGRFVIGEMAYDVVVVPPSTTWRPSTYKMLKQFLAEGGKIIFLGDLPREIDCDSAEDKWLELAGMKGARMLPMSVHNVQEALDKAAPKMFTLRGVDGKPVPATYVHHRVDAGEQILFVVNSDRVRRSDYVLTFFGAAGKNLYVWNAVQGTAAKAQPKVVGQDLRYRFTLPPTGSLLVTVGGNVPDAQLLQEKPDLAEGMIVPLPDIWEHRRLDANVLVLDRLDASLDGGKTWLGEDLEFRIRRKLADHYGTTSALQWQPWVAIRKGLFDGKGGEVVLRYRFVSDIEKPRSAFLVMEDLKKGKVQVNGQNVDVSDADWHWDRGFGKVDIADLIKKGENEVLYTVDYNFLTEVEAAYVVGDFGVALASPREGKLVEEAKELRNGSWVDQTYPFYSGKMAYKTEIEAGSEERTFLRLNNPSGILYKVRVNGEEAGKILWRPFELELTPFLKSGKNELEIEVISSLQNSWGPLHEMMGDDYLWCGPNAFEDEGIIREELSLFNYGLLGGAELVRI